MDSSAVSVHKLRLPALYQQRLHRHDPGLLAQDPSGRGRRGPPSTWSSTGA